MLFSADCAASRMVSVSQAVLLNKMSASIMLLQGIVFVFDLGAAGCMVMRTAIFQITSWCILDNMLLRQLPFVEHSLLSRFVCLFCGWFDVFRSSCGFGELAAIGCCTIEDSRREKLKRSIMFGSLTIVLEKESGFTELPLLSHCEWYI